MNLATFRPTYFPKRVRQWCFERAHPDCPWLTDSAILLLDNWLKPTDVGLEWGSGRSTVWFCRRVANLTSVEDDPQWYARVSGQLAQNGHGAEVDCRLVPCELGGCDEPEGHPYADVALEFPDGSLDFVLVDGKIRLLCVRRALDKLRPGGLLILDNANCVIPNPFDGEHTTVVSPRAEPKSRAWAEIIKQLHDWRWINTSNGIWDTRFWVKPL